MGSGGGFGSDLLDQIDQSVDYGSIGRDFANGQSSPRVTYQMPIPRKGGPAPFTLKSNNNNNNNTNSRFAKPQDDPKPKQKPSVVPAAPPQPVQEEFPTLKPGAPASKSTSRPIMTRRERQELERQRQLEAKQAREKEAAERAAKKERKRKLFENLRNSINPNHRTYLSPVDKDCLVPSMLMKLELDDEKTLVNLGRVIGQSICSDRLPIVTMIKRIVKIPDDNISPELKESIIVKMLIAIHGKLGEMAMLKTVIKDSLNFILEKLGIDTDNPKPQCLELGLEFMIPKINIEEKLETAFAIMLLL